MSRLDTQRQPMRKHARPNDRKYVRGYDTIPAPCWGETQWSGSGAPVVGAATISDDYVGTAGTSLSTLNYAQVDWGGGQYAYLQLDGSGNAVQAVLNTTGGGVKTTALTGWQWAEVVFQFPTGTTGTPEMGLFILAPTTGENWMWSYCAQIQTLAAINLRRNAVFQVGGTISPALSLNADHTLRVEWYGNTFTVKLDGAVNCQFTDPNPQTSGSRVGIYCNAGGVKPLIRSLNAGPLS